MRTFPALLFLATISVGWAAPENVSDFSFAKMPVGRLGKPLGTRLVISGEQGGAVMLANPLTVSEIDGVALASPVAIEIRGGVGIKKGVRYQLEGYEAGEFSGPPSWYNDRAQQPFQYHAFFVVTRMIAPTVAPTPEPGRL
ncbi:hypothetical protein BH09VER1_BH09VER1_44400 [soil metagenome]